MTETQVNALEQLAGSFGFGRGVAHSRKVASLSTSLFDQLSFRGLIPALMPEDRRLLTAAALVHDIGASSPAGGTLRGLTGSQGPLYPEEGHHVRSCRLLQGAVEDSRQVVLRQIEERDWSGLLHCVLWHDCDPHAQLPGEMPVELWRIRPLAGMLRLAEALDHTEKSRVAQVRVIRAPSWVRLLVKSAGPCEEEVAAARRNCDLLAEAIGLRIAVQQVIDDDILDKRPQ